MEIKKYKDMYFIIHMSITDIYINKDEEEIQKKFIYNVCLFNFKRSACSPLTFLSDFQLENLKANMQQVCIVRNNFDSTDENYMVTGSIDITEDKIYTAADINLPDGYSLFHDNIELCPDIWTHGEPREPIKIDIHFSCADIDDFTNIYTHVPEGSIPLQSNRKPICCFVLEGCVCNNSPFKCPNIDTTGHLNELSITYASYNLQLLHLYIKCIKYCHNT